MILFVEKIVFLFFFSCLSYYYFKRSWLASCTFSSSVLIVPARTHDLYYGRPRRHAPWFILEAGRLDFVGVERGRRKWGQQNQVGPSLVYLHLLFMWLLACSSCLMLPQPCMLCYQKIETHSVLHLPAGLIVWAMKKGEGTKIINGVIFFSPN